MGNKAVPLPSLPMVTQDGKIKTEPLRILNRRIVPRNDDVVAQWLVHWYGLAEIEATWEDAKFIMAFFLDFKP